MAHDGCRLVACSTVVVSAHTREIVACAKLKQSRLFERGGIYGIKWHIAKSKLSHKLDRTRSTYLRNDVR